MYRISFMLVSPDFLGVPGLYRVGYFPRAPFTPVNFVGGGGGQVGPRSRPGPDPNPNHKVLGPYSGQFVVNRSGDPNRWPLCPSFAGPPTGPLLPLLLFPLGEEGASKALALTNTKIEGHQPFPFFYRLENGP